jgi:ubiquinone/menaquinone biosynthesis C-methylase UbiE
MAAPIDVETMAKSMSTHFHTVTQQMPSFEQDFVQVSRGVMRYIAGPLVTHMGLKDAVTKPIALLDNACGSGVVTQEVQAALPEEILQSSSFTCADSSAAMVDLVKKRIVSEKWVNTETKVLDAMVGACSLCVMCYMHLSDCCR